MDYGFGFGFELSENGQEMLESISDNDLKFAAEYADKRSEEDGEI